MAGYYGYSKSVNAMIAEREFKFPKSRAGRELKNLLLTLFSIKITLKQAAKEVNNHMPCEKHHTSKMYNYTDYYSVPDIIADRILDDSDAWDDEEINELKYEIQSININHFDRDIKEIETLSTPYKKVYMNIS